ncbi:uncharacterized protein LOC124112657 isoform X2 [Haliotis rufescens]|uniref:uncharacterized protein LOC124112657 isoform X2 n=1 Tax=Haliotis rufescens TaxID=6454 RepID=UPI00201F4F34|nr:uncharacterized protein LOC124112657 isoform X2 [Haliotis rufescens]
MKVFTVVLTLSLSVALGQNVLTGIKDDLQTIGGAIKQTGKDFVPYAATVGKDLLGTLKNDTLKMVGSTITDLLGQALSKLFHIGKRDTLTERDVLTGLKDDLQTIGGAIKQTGKDFVPYAAGVGNDLLETVKNDTLKMVGNTISDLLGEAISKLFHIGKRDTITERDVLTGLKDDLQTIGGAIKQTGKDFVPYAAGVGKDLLGTLKNDTLKMLGGTISDLLQNALANLFHGKRELSERGVLEDLLGSMDNKTISLVGDTIADLIGQAIENLFQGKIELTERDVLTGLKDEFQTIGGAIKETGKDFVPFAASVGKDLLGTLQNDTLKMVGGTLTDLLGQALSKLFHIGKRDTLTERDVLTGLKDDLQTIGGAIKQTGKDFVPYAAGVGKDLLETVKNDTLKMVGNTISDLLGEAISKLFHIGKRDTITERDVLTGLKDDLQTIGGAIKQTGKDFVPYAAGVGKDLLGTLKNDTLKMLGGTISDLLQNALSNLFHGKRELSERGVLEDLLGSMDNKIIGLVGDTIADLIGQAVENLFQGKIELTERDVLTGLKDEFQTIGGAIKETGKDFVPFAASVDKDLLGTLQNDTLKMLGDLIGPVLDNLFHGKSELSKRDLLTGIKNDLQTIGGAIKETGKDFVPFAANVGKDLLGTLQNDTLKMLGGTLTDLIGNALANLFHGKRELTKDDVLIGLKDDLQTIGGAIKQTGKDFTVLGTLPTLKDILSQTVLNQWSDLIHLDPIEWGS